jgi:hypothetical protein
VSQATSGWRENGVRGATLEALWDKRVFPGRASSTASTRRSAVFRVNPAPGEIRNDGSAGAAIARAAASPPCTTSIGVHTNFPYDAALARAHAQLSLAAQGHTRGSS